MFRRVLRFGVVRRAAAALEALENRRLLSHDIGWTDSAGGVTLSYEYLGEDHVSTTLIVTGTDGDDVIRVAADPAAQNLVYLSLNGTPYTLDLDEFVGPVVDTIYGPVTSPSLQVRGGGGDDVLVQDSAAPMENWWFHGGDGNDVLIGSDGNDWLFGGAGDDLIMARGGNDWAEGGDGNDLVFGGDGTDNVYGSAGDDTLFGDAGTDYLYGAAGADVMHGGDGNDNFVPNYVDDGAADVLWGGAGDDAMNHTETDLKGVTRVIGDGDDQRNGGAGLDLIGLTPESEDGSAGEPAEPDADGSGALRDALAAVSPLRQGVVESALHGEGSPAPRAVNPAGLDGERPGRQDGDHPGRPERVEAKRQARAAARTERAERKRQAKAAKLARHQAAREARRLAAEQRREQKTAEKAAR